MDSICKDRCIEFSLKNVFSHPSLQLPCERLIASSLFKRCHKNWTVCPFWSVISLWLFMQVIIHEWNITVCSQWVAIECAVSGHWVCGEWSLSAISNHWVDEYWISSWSMRMLFGVGVWVVKLESIFPFGIANLTAHLDYCFVCHLIQNAQSTLRCQELSKTYF